MSMSILVRIVILSVLAKGVAGNQPKCPSVAGSTGVHLPTAPAIGDDAFDAARTLAADDECAVGEEEPACALTILQLGRASVRAGAQQLAPQWSADYTFESADILGDSFSASLEQTGHLDYDAPGKRWHVRRRTVAQGRVIFKQDIMAADDPVYPMNMSTGSGNLTCAHLLTPYHDIFSWLGNATLEGPSEVNSKTCQVWRAKLNEAQSSPFGVHFDEVSACIGDSGALYELQLGRPGDTRGITHAGKLLFANVAMGPVSFSPNPDC